MNNTQKPVTVIRAEFKHNLINLINNCGLPAFIVEPILKDLYTETRRAAKLQEAKDLEIWNNNTYGTDENT